VEISSGLAKRLLDAAPDPTFIVDAQGTVVYASSQVENAFGFATEELIDQPIEMLLPERYRLGHVSQRDGFFASPKPRQMGAGLDLYVLHKDGHEIAVEISLSPVQTEQGLLVAAAVRDVSDQKAIERQLLDASRAKSRFLAAASHDLRQPIQALNLLNRVAKSVAADETHLAVIDKQQKSLDSMSRLLNALLDISKLEAGMVKPDITDCAVQEIFEDIRVEFEEQAEAKGLDLVVEKCRDVARSDSRLLTQILENLISNAIRYTKKGFVHLRCLHRDVSIRIEVLDTGLGIAPDDLDEIFEEFHQVDYGTSRPEGLGLGLSIVKRTAEILGCDLEVRSEVGEGSIFSVTVPRGDTAYVRDQEQRSEPLPAAVGGLVLIVEDETAVAEATGLLLKTVGYEVLTAASESEALACLDMPGSAPDLLITDYHLRGGTTGRDVIQLVREHVASELPVIMISGDTSDRLAVDELEGTTFLTKPVDVEQLLSEIRRRLVNG